MGARLGTGHDRVLFAQLLRGFAALSVVVSHWLGVFWIRSGAAASLTNSPEFTAPVPGLVRWLHEVPIAPHVTMEYGHFGVALFFLISGFVIPFSLKSQSRVQFLIGRAFRIWPTYLAGFTLTLIAIALVSYKYGRPVSYSAKSVLAHAVMLRDWLWMPAIDGIVWTLEIELKFYLLCALMAATMVRPRVWPLLVAVAVFDIAAAIIMPLRQSLAQHHLRAYELVFVVSMAGVMMTFMMVGTVFNFLLRGAITARAGVITIGVLLVSFVVQWHYSTLVQPDVKAWSSAAWQGPANYLVAFAVFGVSYLLRNRFVNLRPLAWLADVSYPLYVVHGVVGYAIMRLMWDWTGNPAIAILTAAVPVAVLCTLLHRYVENPSNDLGKRLGKRWVERRARPASATPVSEARPATLDIPSSTSSG